MLKDIFDKMTESKVEWHESRFDWKTTLEQEFPTMMSVGLNDLESDIEKELDILLASCVVNKSGRFIITLINEHESWHGNKVVLSRKPGLHYPYSSGRDIPYRNYNKVSENGDIVNDTVGQTKTKEPIKSLALSYLKTESKINQDKLTEFYQHLQTFFELVKERQTTLLVLTYDVSDSIHKKGNEFLRLFPKSKGYMVELGVKKKHNKNYYGDDTSRIEWTGIAQFGLDIHSDVKEEVESDERIKSLRLMQKHFEVFHNAMKEYEVIKTNYVKKLMDLFETLKTTNVAFRVLNKITNND